MGSELSAASGRSSEVSEWPRSKFPASAVRQRRNFGHRNRVIAPYESVTRSAVVIGRGDVGIAPYGGETEIHLLSGGVEPRPYGGQQGVRKKNPPVTASPCRPPLGKGAMGTGDADCHSRCAHRLRNDSFFARGQCKAGRRGGGTPPYGG